MSSIREAAAPIFEAAKHITDLGDLAALAVACGTPMSNTCLQAAGVEAVPACFDLQIRWARAGCRTRVCADLTQL